MLGGTPTPVLVLRARQDTDRLHAGQRAHRALAPPKVIRERRPQGAPLPGKAHKQAQSGQPLSTAQHWLYSQGNGAVRALGPNPLSVLRLVFRSREITLAPPPQESPNQEVQPQTVGRSRPQAYSSDFQPWPCWFSARSAPGPQSAPRPGYPGFREAGTGLPPVSKRISSFKSVTSGFLRGSSRFSVHSWF